MDPNTLATVSAASMGMSAIGNIAQGRSTAASDSANAQIAQNNAAVATQNASFTAQEGNANAERQQLANRARMGAIATNQGASGVDVNSGSSIATRDSADQLGNLDVATIRANAARQAYGYETQSTNFSNQANIDSSAAKNAVTSSYINAGTSLLSQGATAAQRGTFDVWARQSNGSALNSSEIDQPLPFDTSVS